MELGSQIKKYRNRKYFKELREHNSHFPSQREDKVFRRALEEM